MANEKNILIIDDDIDILYTLSEICKYQGWNAYTATGYCEAAQYLSEQNNVLDIILVDYHMPDMDGIAVVTELRKILPSIPIIVLTVEERDSIVDRFMQAGATDYALKPIKAVDLISRIKVHLQYAQRSEYYKSYTKGISKVTLQIIESCLGEVKDFLPIETIEEKSGIKRKTLYRYLQYLVQEGRVEVEYAYQNSGRPKSSYRIK